MIKVRDISSEEIKEAEARVFIGDGYAILPNYINTSDVLLIRSILFRNSKCFRKVSESGNHRLFHYPCSPYRYPAWLESLY